LTTRSKAKIHDAKFNEYTTVANAKNSSGFPVSRVVNRRSEVQSSPRFQTYQGVAEVVVTTFFIRTESGQPQDHSQCPVSYFAEHETLDIRHTMSYNKI